MGPSALLALIIAAGGSAAAAGESAPFSLTLQGAASLGTYEAAVNWTVIRLIRSNRLEEDAQRGRRPDLEALSGSSAGSVNALLAAALWCEADDEVENLSVDRNLLRDVWLPIGLDQLLPGDPALYTPSDGLFAASAFTPVVDSVQSRVFSGKGLALRAWMPRAGGLHHDPRRSPAPHASPPGEVTADSGATGLRGGSSRRSQAPPRHRAAVHRAGSRHGHSRRYLGCLGSVHSRRPGDPGVAGLGGLPGRLRSTAGVRVPPGVRGWAARGHPRSVPGALAREVARRSELFRLQRRPGWPGVQALPEQLHRRWVPGQRAGGAGRRAGRGLLFTQDTPPPHRAARRSQHPTAAGGTSACAERAVQGFSDAVQMGNDLVATAREQRLAEAIVSRHWNLTTRALLFRTASALAADASIVSQLEGGQASTGGEPTAPAWRPAGQERGPLGRFVARCLRRRPLAGAELEACAATVQGKGGNVPAGLDAGARARAQRPSPPTRCFTSPRIWSPSSRAWVRRRAGPVSPSGRRWQLAGSTSSPTSWSPFRSR